MSRYTQNTPLNPAGVFTGGNYVVSMRLYHAQDIECVRAITAPYAFTHGEPVAWAWDAVGRLGIADIMRPEWGDCPLGPDGRQLSACITGGAGVVESDDMTPVCWGCGVTPQETVMKAGLQGTLMVHRSGYILVLECLDGVLRVE
ncbi:hypothetical protein BJX63DRAFT_433318 [Aspergillus granulosus]|uniref:Uncharacterized protein n=1 Tax=Aspergillus granulosus TaxID=176169 RepID=A0ABR4H7P8_9EURO